MNGSKHCPFCREEIKFAAIKCKHCGSMLSGSGPRNDILSGIDLVRQVLGERYDVIEEIGRGGMSAVYKGIQRNLFRPVALKVIQQNLVHNKDLVDRFHREAQVCASISHPNIITVYYEGEVSGLHFMAMEYLEGIDLHKLVRTKGKLSANQTLQYLVPVAEALEYAHHKGLIHCDIKSSNIFITGSGRVVLMDFGIARASGPKMTLGGYVIGTPEYMSPEQAEGREVDHRTDLYSLGVVMYECLTGRVPFRGENAASTIDKLIHEIPQKEGLCKTPVSLQQLTLRLLSKDPDDRPIQASGVATAIKQIQQGRNWKSIIRKNATVEGKSKTKQKKTTASKQKIPSAILVLGGILLLLVSLIIYQLPHTGKLREELSQHTSSQQIVIQQESSVHQPSDSNLSAQAEKEAWEQARRVSSVASYEKYLEMYPAGTYAAKATEVIAGLKEQESWRQESGLTRVRADKALREAVKQTDSGLEYVFHERSGGETPDPESILSMNIVYRLEDSVLFDNADSGMPMYLQLIDPEYPGDIYEGLSMMTIGDSASFRIDAENFFLQTAGMMEIPPFIDQGDKLTFDVKILRAMNEEEFAFEQERLQEKQIEADMARADQEEGLRQEYLDEKGITLNPTLSGLYFVEREPGDGPRVQTGQIVAVHYEGRMLDGMVFDSSYERGEPIEFVIGEGRVIEGWEEGIGMMRKGGRAQLVIPSNLAYGEMGAGDLIPPFSTLVFDVEVVDVQNQ